MSLVCPSTPHLIPWGLFRSIPALLCLVRPVPPPPSCPLLSCFILFLSFPSRFFPPCPMLPRHAPHHHPSLLNWVFCRPVTFRPYKLLRVFFPVSSLSHFSRRIDPPWATGFCLSSLCNVPARVTPPNPIASSPVSLCLALLDSWSLFRF